MCSGSDNQFSAIVQAARSQSFGPTEIAGLAERLATSGARIAWPSDDWIADIPSTGGPGSLSTLIGPLLLRGIGLTVVKLGVPGRPAGAIDSLGTLSGYRVFLTPEEVRAVVADCGFAHFVAGDPFTPMDAALFEYRRRTNTIAVPTLAAASILSKKVAVGVRAVALDVRVGPYGNFGSSWSDARKNAQLFCDAAKILGIEAVAVLSSAVDTIQPLIGRGEALIGLAVATGLIELTVPGLDRHLKHCRFLADAVPSRNASLSQSGRSNLVTSASWRADLARHLRAQGSSIEELMRRVYDVQNQRRHTICARSEGVVQWDLEAIRNVIIRRQAAAPTGSFNDPAGVQLCVDSGTRVGVGDELLCVRCDDASELDELVVELESGFRLSRDPEPSAFTPVEIVRG